MDDETKPPPPDGGPAFPLSDIGMYGHHGMSLRDWFAGQALAGSLANSEGIHAETEPTMAILSGERRASFARFLAVQAYALADAMLEVRK